jgi:hypothetical protein
MEVKEQAEEIKSVFEQFNASGTWLDGHPTGSGHIHSTWLIKTREKVEPDFILQKINHNVFPPVEQMMNNIEIVTNHIRQKREPGSIMQVLEIIGTKSQKNYLTDQKGNYWRMYRKIDPGKSYDIVPDGNIALEAGRAFGQFMADLGDLPPERIFPVIPGFNSMEMRFANFEKAVSADPSNRLAEVKKEVDFAYRHIESMLVISNLEKEGKLPLRITHNDTKLNNVLFDENDRAVCIIDLDTVMPGLSLYDFGDTIRTAANTGNEDEEDLAKIELDIAVFKSFARGFIEKTHHFLIPREIEYLTLSAQYMTFIMGIRFLTDYISGDVYYTIHYENQNIRRCRAQFRLIEDMIDKYVDCQNIIDNIIKKY